MTNLNIMLIYNDFLGKQNGSNTHILELFNSLKLDNKVVFIGPKPLAPISCNNSFEFVSLPRFIYSHKILFHLFYQLFLLLKLFRIRNEFNPNLIYSRLDGFSISPVIFSKIYKIPIFIEVNGLFIDQINMRFSKSKFLKIAILSEKINYHFCDKIITVTDGLKDALIKMYHLSPEKISVIENGVNTKLFKPMDIVTSKSKSKLELNIRYICFVGNFVKWQGIEYIIEASNIVCEKIPNVCFLIVGDGEIKKDLQDLARKLDANNLYFTGRVSYDDVPYYINSCEICLAPFIVARNHRIGLSALKTYEYLACSKPVVATAIPGVKELLESSKGGIIVQPENYNELANAIIYLLQNPNISQKMGTNGRTYVENEHTWDSVARKIRDLFIY